MRSIGFVPLISHLAETFLPIYGGGGRLLLRGNAAYDNKAPLSTSAAGGAARFDPRQAPCLGLLLHRGAGTRSRVTMSVHGGDAGAAAAAAGGGGGGGGGKAFLVGSGIGGEEFLTVKGMELLKTADAVVYDALADEALLSLCKPSCEFHNVGKRGGERDTSTPQEEIDSLLVRLANSPGRASSSPSSSPDGKRVVRLKAGDPFIFGRSKGEIKALEAAGVPFEVVPGLSSAITGPLMAGIALTDPDLSKSFAVLSGFDKDSQMPDQVGRKESSPPPMFQGSRV
jgi:siroheme synthase